jgi:acetylornithine deacetylase/succinyl-diaminopimelate desuccinylase-like protein
VNGQETEKRRRHRNERIAAAVIVLLLVGATIALLVISRRQENAVQEQMYIPKETPLTAEAELLRDYIRINTTNPPGNERAGDEWLAKILRANGVQPELIDSAPGRTNLYARIKGKRPGEGLLLLNHIDVITADPKQWKQPPFSANVFLNEIYGRGALDMKGTAICELRAFLDVATAGKQPERDIVFLAVADEEVGSGALGLGWLVEHRPDVIDGIRYSVNEGGITEMVQEKVTYFGIEIGTKLTVTVILEAPTREQLQKARIALEPRFTSR